MTAGKPQRRVRDQLIQDMRAQGIPWRKVAAAVGLSIRQAQAALAQAPDDAASTADREYIEAVALRERIVRANP